MLRAGKIWLRARDEADVAVLHAELYEDIVTYMTADSRPWRPIPAGSSASPYAIDEPRDDLAVFSVVELASGELAGAALLWAIDLHNRTAHLGLSLRPTYRGRGLGSDVVLALCEYGFAVRGLHRLQVDTLASNVAMIGGASRAGFVQEGRLRRAAWVNGEFVDEVILGLLASDWAGARLPGAQQGALEDQRHEQLAVAVLVEQHRDVVAVVALHRAPTPALAHHARAHRERDLGRRGF
jgi:RimJ/RimL family protein N-acetyltransferase